MAMEEQHQNPTLSRQAAWVVGWRIVGIVATLGVNILAARLLGPAHFAVFLLITTIMAFGSLLGMAGLNEAGLRYVSENLALERFSVAHAYLRRMLLTVAGTSLLAALVVAVCIAAYQLWSGQRSQMLVLLTACGIVALAWQQMAAESLRSYGNLRSASLFSGGQTGGPVSNLLCLAALACAPWLLVPLDAAWAIGFMVASIAVTAPLALWSLWRTSHSNGSSGSSCSLDADQRRTLLAVGGVLMINQLLAFGSQQFDIWIGGALLQPATLGLYGAAKRSLLLAAMPVQMAMMTMLPIVPRLYALERREELERAVRSAATFAAMASLPALALLILFPEPILRLAFGGSYAGAASTVLVLAAGYLVLVVSGNPPYVLTMTGRHKLVVIVNLISMLVMVLCGALGAHFFGAPGLAAGSAVSFALQNGLLWWFARRELGVWTHLGAPLWPARERDAANLLSPRCAHALPEA